MPSPGSVVVIRDEDWLVLRSEASADGEWFVDVQGLTELVRDTAATFSTGLDQIKVLDPAEAEVVGDDTPGFRRSRLWLEAVTGRSRTCGSCAGQEVQRPTGDTGAPLRSPYFLTTATSTWVSSTGRRGTTGCGCRTSSTSACRRPMSSPEAR
jgi:hypothetical protein